MGAVSFADVDECVCVCVCTWAGVATSDGDAWKPVDALLGGDSDSDCDCGGDAASAKDGDDPDMWLSMLCELWVLRVWREEAGDRDSGGEEGIEKILANEDNSEVVSALGVNECTDGGVNTALVSAGTGLGVGAKFVDVEGYVTAVDGSG